MDEKELEAAVEGILFASGEPLHIERICFALSIERPDAERALRRLQDYYAFERRGMRLLRMEDRWQLCSSPDHADAIRKAFEIRKPAKLSQPALEALTIIAYYQPTTRAYVDKLRGVDSAYTVGLLLERGLIETCGNLQAPGRPLLYRTTEKFLRSFHISSLDELPPLNEDDIPPQQLKIEDIAKPKPAAPDAESVSETETASDAENVPETEVADEPEAVPDAESVKEPEAVPEAETMDEPETVPDAETVDELETVPDAETVDEPEAVPDAESVKEPEAVPEAEIAVEPENVTDAESVDEPETEVADKPEASFPPRELMAVSYPRLLAANPVPVRRKPARKPYRMAGTFRTRRKRPGPKRRKRRKIARPRRDVPDTPSPDASDIPQPPPRRGLSGKIVRRCLHCLLCGCWLSWPFCSF